ncbi:MAG: alkaline phosphatase family protein [Candidatus Latescibacterota bacterium]|nr:alkaline phosphatase family protein [Candidatus Latescibacterota bacterium]
MATPARRAIVVGMDGASMELVKNMADAGHMPNVRTLMRQGVWRPMVGVFPTLTPPGWTALSTGSWPGTHGVMDFGIHIPGRRLDDTEWGINTELCQSEYIWNTFERGGKKPILVKWEMSWPPTVRSGVQVEGTGPGVSNHHQIAGYHLFVAGKWAPRRLVAQRDPETLDPSALQTVSEFDPVTLGEAAGWSNLPESRRPIKEVVLTIRPLTRSRRDMHWGKSGTPRPFYAIVYARGSKGYDRVCICRSRDASKPVADLGVGDWSEWWLDRFEIDNKRLRGYVRAKLITLTRNADAFELFFPQIWPTQGYTKPASIASEIDREVGNFLQNPARDALGLIDDDTYFELLEFHHQRLADVAEYLVGSRDWDLLMAETHASDYTSHFFLRSADPHSGAPASVRQRCEQGVERTYASIDRWIGRLRKLADEDTTFFVVADHGGTSQQHTVVDVEQVLAEAGFVKYAGRGGNRRIDWSRTTAAPVGLVHIFVNLKGREPNGIVKRTDYDRFCQDIIQALYDYTDPDTGRRTFALAVTNEDAEMVNLSGDRVGDVVYALRPEYDGAHGKQLPSVRFGMAGQHSTFIAAGAGIRRGGMLQREVRVIDVAPTVCYLTGAPMPRNVEGGVIYEALTEPDLHC